MCVTIVRGNNDIWWGSGLNYLNTSLLVPHPENTFLKNQKVKQCTLDGYLKVQRENEFKKSEVIYDWWMNPSLKVRIPVSAWWVSQWKM